MPFLNCELQLPPLPDGKNGFGGLHRATVRSKGDDDTLSRTFIEDLLWA